jgi:hypothetical protein
MILVFRRFLFAISVRKEEIDLQVRQHIEESRIKV